ncbi:MAG: dihydropteroate synthase [Gammaproteobacteria bacterium]|jgi:dihydropteroate synthase|nr:dihydropteroate synthase [Gammaproteobacteria bacterium]
MLLRCGKQTIDLTQPVVMGVLNVTPDSFSDGGKFLDIAAAVAHGLRMVEEGAAIIDVGGESTRPGADPVSVEAEIRRVIPVVEQLRAKTNAVISVDTSKPQVIRAAAEAGAGLINDVRALSEEGALEAAAGTQCAVCVMHMQGDPRSMQLAPHYADVVNEVKAFLAERVRACRAAGIAAERIVIDPGFGFGKTLEHNLELLRYLRELGSQPSGPEWPIMVGLSRKSIVGRLTGRSSGERVHGSVALALMAVINGADIIRVHDVGPTVDALKTFAAVQGARRTAEVGE